MTSKLGVFTHFSSLKLECCIVVFINTVTISTIFLIFFKGGGDGGE